MLASAVLHLAYFQTLLRGYRLFDLTVFYPAAHGTGPLLGSLGAVLLLGETMSAVGVAGAQAWHVQWRYALVGAVLGPLGDVLVLYAVRLAPLSHVAPARAVSMLYAALVGDRLLGEGERGAHRRRTVHRLRRGGTCARLSSTTQHPPGSP